MTAKELYELTAPLFAKHPSAKPPRLFQNIPNECGCFWRFDLLPLSDNAAALIIQGHLAQWLAEKSNGLTIRAVYDDPMCWTANQGQQRDSILKSLIFACMEVEK
jgi:hypothetical protein